MKVVSVNLYNINELKESVKNKLIEKEKEYLINSNFEFLKEILEEMLNEKNIDYKDISYSLGYCQGDGLNFTSDMVLDYERLEKQKNLNPFEEYLFKNLDKKKYKFIIDRLIEGYNLKIAKHNYHYEHCNTTHFEGDIEEFLSDEILKEFKLIYNKICYELEKEGYNCYEVSDEEAIESLLNYGEVFDEQGRIL